MVEVDLIEIRLPVRVRACAPSRTMNDVGYDILAIALLIVSVTVATGWILARDGMRRGDEVEVGRVWASYARARGLVFEDGEGEGPARTLPRVLSDDLQITVIRDGERLATRLVLRPRHAMLGRLVVTTDDDAADLPAIPLDSQTMDAALHVFASPKTIVASVLSNDVVRALSGFRMGGFLRFEYGRGRVALEWKNGELNAARLDEARRLATLIADAVNDAFERPSR
jgi:hypothetical protein